MRCHNQKILQDTKQMPTMVSVDKVSDLEWQRICYATHVVGHQVGLILLFR